jgi:enoyl-CoA hydratase
MSDLRVERDGAIAIVTLDRPPVNALAQDTFAEIGETFTRFSVERDVSAVILTAAGDRAFCGGVDLNDSPRRYRTDGRAEDGGERGDARHQVDSGRVVRDCFWGVYDCSVPVIAAVNGAAIGAGTALVASCDLVVASTRARFALTEINVGVLGGVKHAQRLVGPFLAKRMFLTGEAIPAEELYRRGAIEAVVPPDELMDTALELARKIVAKSPIAVRLAKESANRVEFMDLKEGYRTEQDYTTRVKRFKDSDEARLAYLGKRDAVFGWE